MGYTYKRLVCPISVHSSLMLLAKIPTKAVKKPQRIAWKAREVNEGRGKILKIFAL